jgi:glycosyltransferase involved in cell wall biosynthesis
MKILFVARTYPPFVGGMEKFASDFFQNLNQHTDVDLFANPHGKKKFVQFFFKAVFHLILNSHKYDIIHFNDAVLAPLLPIIRLFSKAKICFTVHGLDIVFKKMGYQYMGIPFLKYADKIFPVSQYTKEQCEQRKIPSEILTMIPNGLDFSNNLPCTSEQKQSLTSRININYENKTILLSLGRLIKRKGHAWFIENVFINLPESYIYLIAGNAREFDNISELIQRLSLQDRVIMLGFVTEGEKACLFQMADLFIMPNIYQENDQEGFGIVLLEAGSYSLPSIASNIEGIKDAVIHGVTGVLVEEKDTKGFTDAIINPNIDREQIRQELESKYNWKIISQTYYNEFSKLVK